MMKRLLSPSRLPSSPQRCRRAMEQASSPRGIAAASRPVSSWFTFALAALFLLCARLSHAQEEPIRTDASTQVSTIRFEFVKTRSFRESDLRSRISLSERGDLPGVRNFLDFLPMIEPVGDHPFDAMELQRDVVRLRSLYRRAGFLQTAVTYDIAIDREANLIDITFIIDEGTPVLLRGVRVTGDSNGTPLTLPDDAEKNWQASSSDILPATDERLNLFDLPNVEARTSNWFMEQGYPFVRSQGFVTVDSLSHTAILDLRVMKGPRSRIGAITVQGEQTVRERVLVRELPFSEGDLFSPGALREGRREILGLGLFRRVAVEIPQGTPPSEVVPVLVDVTEAPPRLVTGSAGYDSRGGLTGQADWQHHNFTGDARTFAVSALAQTGVWALEEIPEILYRGSLSLTQPYIFHRRLSLLGGPFVEHRDDYRDRSNAVGFLATLIYQIDPLRSFALNYSISKRFILETRYGEYTSGAIDILTLLSIQSKGDRVLKNTMGVQASYGSLDDFAIPRRGYLLRPTAEVTFVPALNSVEYFRFTIPVFAFQPLSETIGMAFRCSMGSILPFGNGLPQEGETSGEKFLQFRDIIFMAGGPDDVRGWGSRLLGPKAPDIRIESVSPDTIYSVNGYIPVGGLSRVTFSLECRFPVPGLGPAAGLSLFVDGARIWNAKPQFQSVGWGDEDKFFFGTGLGFLYRLPIGTVRIDTGYKLNPSYQDLREAKDVVSALLAGTPLDQVPAKESKRFHVHLSISVSF